MLLLHWWVAFAAANDDVPPAKNPLLSDPAPSAESALDLLEAGLLTVDARQPVEILLSGAKLAQLYVPGKTTFRLVPGTHVIRLYTNGNPEDFDITLAADEEIVFLVGRSGTTMDRPVVVPVAAGPVQIELRYVGGGGAQVRFDGRPLAVRSGQPFRLELPVGSHPMSVRSSNGTVIWASGTLEVGTGRPVVVQLTEGRMPEVSGPGRFFAGGG